MPNIQQIRILRFAGWRMRDIEQISDEEMKQIERSLFYNWNRVRLILHDFKELLVVLIKILLAKYR